MARTRKKKCSRCGKAQPAAAFYREPSGRLGSWCKACYVEYRHERYKQPAGEDAVECALCGIRRRDLSQHLRSRHGLTSAEYRRLHNAPTVSPALRAFYRDVWLIDKENKPTGSKRRRYCKRGHYLREPYVRVRIRDGREQRECLRCSRERSRLGRLRQEAAGLCIECWKAPARPGATRCEDCLAKGRDRQRERRAAARLGE